MRFLKNKIMKAMEAHQKKLETESSSQSGDMETVSTTIAPSPTQECSNQPAQHKQIKKRCRKFDDQNCKPRRPPSSTKNMSINFGKAIASFASSHLAIPYLEPYLDRKEFTYNEFLAFANQGKEKIGSIETFRSLILSQESDNAQQIAMKITFKALAEIFIKYFSVNWITHGKITHKLVYLKYRLKMLRRVRDPENFTFVKKRAGSRKNKGSKNNVKADF